VYGENALQGILTIFDLLQLWGLTNGPAIIIYLLRTDGQLGMKLAVYLSKPADINGGK